MYTNLTPRPVAGDTLANNLERCANILRGIQAGNWNTLDAVDASRLSDVAVALTKLAQEARDVQ